MNENEAAFLLYIQEHWRTPFFDVFFNIVTLFAEIGLAYILFSLILFAVRKTRKTGTVLCLSCAADGLIVNLLLKNIFHRTRPFHLVAYAEKLIPAAWIVPHSFSFPSGHTAIAFAVATASVGHMKKRYTLLLFLLALLIGFSRLYLGVHYPTDVFGGAIAGAVAGVAAQFLSVFLRRKCGDKLNRIFPDML